MSAFRGTCVMTAMSIGLLLASCSISREGREWMDLVPADAIAIYVPTEEDHLAAAPNAAHSSLFIGSIQQDLQTIWDYAGAQDGDGVGADADAGYGSGRDGDALEYEALILSTDLSTRVTAGWILAEAAGERLLDRIGRLDQDGSSVQTDRAVSVEDRYRFSGVEIRRLRGHSLREPFYSARLGGWLVVSSSPEWIQRVILAHRGEIPSLALPSGITPDELEDGDLVLNVGRMDDWALVMTRILSRPLVQGTLDGGGTAVLRPDRDGTGDGWRLSGSVEMDSAATGDLTRLLDGLDRPSTLDRYISQSAAAFARVQVPADEASAGLFTGSWSADSARLHDADLFLLSRGRSLDLAAQSLGSEMAVVAMAESGFNAGSELLHLRELEDPLPLGRLLDELVSEDLASLQGGTYMVRSRLLEGMITRRTETSGSWIYMDLLPDAVAVSPRQGLTESVRSDAGRRSTLRYEDGDRKPASFEIGIRTQAFSSFIAPWLLPDLRPFDSLQESDRLLITGHRRSDSDPVSITVRSIPSSDLEMPYLDRWTHPLSGTELSGPAILADIGGTNRPEVIFATEGGSVIALAADGTSVLQLSTGSDVPVGSPVAYDWYGTRQNVLLLAAGRAIYGWDANGNRLPGFPIRMGEPIVGGLVVDDVNRDGLPDMVVATADRNVHVLNSRGEPQPGWPQAVNTMLTDDPAVIRLGNRPLIIAVADNTLHIWQAGGEPFPGFPMFEQAPFASTPVLANEHTLLAATQAGEILSISLEPPGTPFFGDSAAAIRAGGIERMQVSEPGSMVSAPVFRERVSILLRAAETGVNGGSDAAGIIDGQDPTAAEGMDDSTVPILTDVMLIGSSAGTLRLLDRSGRPLHELSMGQRLAPGHPPAIRDIDGDRRLDIVSVGEFGRLHAWDLATGDRREDLPANAIAMPVFSDLDGDGRVELIAVTREGLRCWTLDPR